MRNLRSVKNVEKKAAQQNCKIVKILGFYSSCVNVEEMYFLKKQKNLYRNNETLLLCPLYNTIYAS